MKVPLSAAVGVALAVMAADPAGAGEGDDQINTFVQVEQLEYRLTDGNDSVNWDAGGWIGEDYNKLWFKTEGEKVIDGKLEEAEFQLLYSRQVSPFFDFQAGLRGDAKPEPVRAFGVVGLQGLAPQFFEVDTAAFVSNRGEVSARLEAEYEVLLTQRLILQPSVELNLAAQDVRERGVGSGINDIEFGLRLRYEVEREFAPYIGINWSRKIGETADFAEEEGEAVDALSFVAGVRFWF